MIKLLYHAFFVAVMLMATLGVKAETVTESALKTHYEQQLMLDVSTDSLWLENQRQDMLKYYERIQQMEDRYKNEDVRQENLTLLWRTSYLILIGMSMVIVAALFYWRRMVIYKRKLSVRQRRIENAKKHADERNAFIGDVIRNLSVTVMKSYEEVDEAVENEDVEVLAKAVDKFTKVVNEAMYEAEGVKKKVAKALMLLLTFGFIFEAQAQNNPYGMRDELYELHARIDLMVQEDAVLPLTDSLFNRGLACGDTVACLQAWDARMGHAYFTHDINIMREVFAGAYAFAEKTARKYYIFYAWNRIVLFYLNRGDYITALTETDKYRRLAVEMNEPYGISRGYFYMGEICRRTGLYQEAVKEYKKGLENVADNDKRRMESSDHYVRMAECLIELKEYDEAVECLRQALVFAKRDAHRLNGYSTLLKLYARKGDVARATEMVSVLKTFNVAEALHNDYRTYDYYDSMLSYYALVNDRENVKKYMDLLGDSHPETQMRVAAKFGDYVTAMRMQDLWREQKQHDRDMMSKGGLIEAREGFEQDYTIRNTKLMKQELGVEYMNIVRWVLTFVLVSIIISLFVFFSIHSRNRRKLDKENERLAQACRESVEANERKSRFMKMLSHELRTPLNAIFGFSQVLPLVDDKEEIAEMHRMIRDNMISLENMVKSVGQISEIDYQDSSFERKPVNIKVLCEIILSSAKKYSDSKPSVHMLMSPYNGPEVIISDARRLYDVLMILIDNAYKFTSLGHVQLSCLPVGDELAFCVEDTGAGIPADKVDTIFNSFVKADEYNPGLGLGLTICRLSAKKLGGTIYIDPMYIGPGTRVVLKVPMNNK